MKGIVNGRIILKDRIVENKVLLYDEKIAGIQDPAKDLQGIDLLDAGGCYVSPGFIDIHIHGAFGFDAMDWNDEAISSVSEGLCRNGVTAFLPTTMSMDKESIARALSNICKASESEIVGAKVLGAHLEGPFINPLRRGAHGEQHIIKADYGLIKDYLNVIKLITIAPEIEGNIEFIEKMQRYEKISFSIGHSNATYEEAMTAIACGIKSAAHAFNAMSPLNHREPGVAGAILNSDIYCELIADKVHVHPAMFQILIKAKSSSKIILITDSIRAAGMKQGTYELGGQQVIVEKGSARLTDGTLAGSVLRMNEAVRNMLENTDLPMHAAVAMATLNPAKLIGMDNEIGSIEAGKKADITIFDDNINIKATIVDGKLMSSYKQI